MEGRPRIVLVHGSVMGGRPTWSGQRALAERFQLEILDRPGFPPNPQVDHVDFEEHAQLVAEAIRGGAHLVGHSYGGVIALLAAAAEPRSVRSLTVIEPPAMGVARGHPAVDDFTRRGVEWWEKARPTIRKPSCVDSSALSALRTSRPHPCPPGSSRVPGR